VERVHHVWQHPVYWLVCRRERILLLAEFWRLETHLEVLLILNLVFDVLPCPQHHHLIQNLRDLLRMPLELFGDLPLLLFGGFLLPRSDLLPRL